MNLHFSMDRKQDAVFCCFSLPTTDSFAFTFRNEWVLDGGMDGAYHNKWEFACNDSSASPALRILYRDTMNGVDGLDGPDWKWLLRRHSREVCKLDELNR